MWHKKTPAEQCSAGVWGSVARTKIPENGFDQGLRFAPIWSTWTVFEPVTALMRTMYIPAETRAGLPVLPREGEVKTELEKIPRLRHPASQILLQTGRNQGSVAGLNRQLDQGGE